MENSQDFQFYQVLCHLNQQRSLTPELWQQYLTRYAGILHFVAEQIKVTRDKDAANPYRRMTYRNDAEMSAVLD